MVKRTRLYKAFHSQELLVHGFYFQGLDFGLDEHVFYTTIQYVICRILVVIALALFSACWPEAEQLSSELSYVISPQQNMLRVEIKRPDGRQESYLVSEELPKNKKIRTNYTSSEKQLFQFQGFKLFPRCFGSQKKVYKTKLTWAVPEDWKVANSFGAGDRTQAFEASCEQLAEGVFALGPNLNLHRTSFGVLAISDERLNHLAKAYADLIQISMQKVEQFWSDGPEPYYLVLINHLPKGSDSSQGGSAHLHAFQLQLSGEEKQEQKEQLIIHEYFHRWNGHIIKDPPSGNMDDHLEMRWFFEGFTDYFAHQIAQTNPKQNQWSNVSLTELKRNYEHNSAYFEIPYAQGRIVAGGFDEFIKQYSQKSLRDFMLELLARSRADSNFYVTRESFLRTMCEGNYFDCDRSHRIIERYIVQGEQFKSQASP